MLEELRHLRIAGASAETLAGAVAVAVHEALHVAVAVVHRAHERGIAAARAAATTTTAASSAVLSWLLSGLLLLRPAVSAAAPAAPMVLGLIRSVTHSVVLRSRDARDAGRPLCSFPH